MINSLKQKTVKGLFWSFADTLAGQGIHFITGIVLARLLMPREFGLIGMIIIFIALSESFINSGFSSALIRKKDCNKADYSTVFFFSVAIALLFFIALFFSAGFISSFFNEPELLPVVRVLGIVLLVDAITMIHRTILIKSIDFKLQARISFIASAVSGAIAIVLAWLGYGVWSLVAQRLSRQIINTAFLMVWSRWLPSAIFSMKSFKELFGFGSKLLASNLIDTFYNNVYYLIIGRYFSASALGFYTKADEFNRLPAHNISSIIGRVSYPVLCSVQDNADRLRHVYRKFIRSTMFITFIFMMTLAASAEPLIITLLGEKWRESVLFFQLLCLSGMFYPLHVLNLNILQVKGRSDLFLKLEIIKKFLAVPAIVLGIIYGIKVMIIGMLLNTLVDFYLNNHWSRSMIGYSFKEQLKDILPSFVLASVMYLVVFVIGHTTNYSMATTLALQLTIPLFLTIIVGEVMRLTDYLYIKETLVESIGEIRLPKSLLPLIPLVLVRLRIYRPRS